MKAISYADSSTIHQPVNSSDSNESSWWISWLSTPSLSTVDFINQKIHENSSIHKLTWYLLTDVNPSNSTSVSSVLNSPRSSPTAWNSWLHSKQPRLGGDAQWLMVVHGNRSQVTQVRTHQVMKVKLGDSPMVNDAIYCI